jgi:hypothetical protein
MIEGCGNAVVPVDYAAGLVRSRTLTVILPERKEDHKMSALVAQEMPAQLNVGGAQQSCVARLTWTEDRPIEVLFEIMDSAAPWALSRQLLADGLTCEQHNPIADLWLVPGDCGEVCLIMYPGSGSECRVVMPRHEIWAFLGRTNQVVVTGAEQIPDSAYMWLLEDHDEEAM